jgi:hypothetical protein
MLIYRIALVTAASSLSLSRARAQQKAIFDLHCTNKGERWQWRRLENGIFVTVESRPLILIYPRHGKLAFSSFSRVMLGLQAQEQTATGWTHNHKDAADGFAAAAHVTG